MMSLQVVTLEIEKQRALIDKLANSLDRWAIPLFSIAMGVAGYSHIYITPGEENIAKALCTAVAFGLVLKIAKLGISQLGHYVVERARHLVDKGLVNKAIRAVIFKASSIRSPIVRVIEIYSLALLITPQFIRLAWNIHVYTQAG